MARIRGTSVGNAATALAIVALWNIIGLVILALWRSVAPSSRIADQGLLIGVFVLLGGSVSVIVWTRRSDASSWRWVLTMLLGATTFLVFLQFSLGVPLNIDRSRSFHVLLWVSELQPIDEAALLSTVQENLGRDDAEGVVLRLSEHVQRGLIIAKDGEYELSLPGQCIVTTSNWLADVFSLTGWQASSLVDREVT